MLNLLVRIEIKNEKYLLSSINDHCVSRMLLNRKNDIVSEVPLTNAMEVAMKSVAWKQWNTKCHCRKGCASHSIDRSNGNNDIVIKYQTYFCNKRSNIITVTAKVNGNLWYLKASCAHQQMQLFSQSKHAAKFIVDSLNNGKSVKVNMDQFSISAEGFIKAYSQFNKS